MTTATSHVATDSPSTDPVLRVEGLTKHFGAVRAVEDVSFEMLGGEVVGLVGDNGAGKSTLVKMISGVYSPTAGQIYFKQEAVNFQSPAHARGLGIEQVFQDLALVNEIAISSNIFLGRELVKGGWARWFRKLDHREMERQAEEHLKRLHITIPISTRVIVDRLSGGQRQAIAIARAVAFGRELLILDEPTASLGVEQQLEVMGLIERISQGAGLPVIVISHNIAHVLEVCTRIIVLRQGRLVADLNQEEFDTNRIVGHITGLDSARPPDTTRRE